MVLMRQVAFLLMAMSGFAGLVYEVTWHRYLHVLLGSHTKATALILSVFLGGLALGYYIFGKLSRHKSPRFLIKTLGWIELGICL